MLLCNKSFDESVDHLIGTVGSELRVDECEKKDSVEVEVLADEAVGAGWVHRWLIVQVGWDEAVSSEEHLKAEVEHSDSCQNEHEDEPEVEADVELFDDHVENHDARHSVLVLLAKIANFEVTEYNARENAVIFLGGSLELNIPKMEETPEVVVDIEEVLKENHLENAVNNESKLEEEVVDGGLASVELSGGLAGLGKLSPHFSGKRFTGLGWFLILHGGLKESK